MRASLKRFALASELATAPLMRALIVASASMKKFTVEPVPTPTIMSSFTYCSAASAAAFFCAFASILEAYRSGPRAHGAILLCLRVAKGAALDEERRLPGKDPHREGLRRGDREPARAGERHLAAHGQPYPAQARGQAAGVLVQAARLVQQDGPPHAGEARARRHLRERGQPRAGRGARRPEAQREGDGRDARDHAAHQGDGGFLARREGRAPRRQLPRRLPARTRSRTA